MGKIMPVRGLRRRWLVNSMAIVFVIVLVIVAVFSIFIANYYYGNMESSLKARATTTARFLSANNLASYDEFYASVSRYAGGYVHKDVIELEFISNGGRIEASSTGQTAGIVPGTRDVAEALKTQKAATFQGDDPLTGERVISVTVPLYYNNTQMVGALRLVSALSLADRRVLNSMLLASSLGFALLLLIVGANFFFISSITRSLREINDIAKRIADGSYGIRIEKQYNDEIGELADTLNDMSSEIRTAEKIKTEFISNVSHELRTPLTAITGWGETLLAGDISDHNDVRKGIKIMLKETSRLSTMVEQLLDFTRRDSGKFVMNMQPIDPRAEFEELLEFYHDVYQSEGIALEYSIGESLPPIVADKERLKQVIINLIDNAAKHGGEGKRIDVSLTCQNDFVVFSVRDYGPGIAPEDLPHVKMKYYRGTSSVRGSGIGLSIADELIRAHNGTLDIESTEGEGTTVVVRLPVTKMA